MSLVCITLHSSDQQQTNTNKMWHYQMNFILHSNCCIWNLWRGENITIIWRKERKGEEEAEDINSNLSKIITNIMHSSRRYHLPFNCQCITTCKEDIPSTWDGDAVSMTCVLLARIVAMYPPLHYHHLPSTTWNCVVSIRKRSLLQMLGKVVRRQCPKRIQTHR